MGTNYSLILIHADRFTGRRHNPCAQPFAVDQETADSAMLFEIALVANCSLDMGPAYLESQVGHVTERETSVLWGGWWDLNPRHPEPQWHPENLQAP